MSARTVYTCDFCFAQADGADVVVRAGFADLPSGWRTVRTAGAALNSPHPRQNGDVCSTECARQWFERALA